jgi:signal transduction histidine kinase
MQALVLKKKISPQTPFVVLTGSMNEETAVECMKEGADDYVIKEHIRRLPLAVESALANAIVRNEKRKAEYELARSELLLRTAINNLPSTFIIYDKNIEIEYINEFGLTIYGVSEKDAIAALHRTYETSQSQFIECQINYPGMFRYVIYYFVPILDDQGQIDKVMAIAYDITDRKNFEININKARTRAEESDRLKSAFISNISHEIRTPLNAILGFSQLIIKAVDGNENLVNYAKIILESGNHLLDIIKQMLEISQLESGISQKINESFSVQAMMEEIYQLFMPIESKETMQNIEFIQKPENIPEKDLIFSDREKLFLILKSLIGNAFKYTKCGIVEYGYQWLPEGLLKFWVKDTGIGIEKDKIEWIFNAFRQADETHTRKYGGIGLGLAISKSLVHLLGGQIWVESEPGKGSAFYFTIKAEP